MGELRMSEAIEKRRLDLQKLEQMMLQEKQVDVPVTHRFHGGMYAREVFIPADTVAMGHIHKFNHFIVVLSGEISAALEDGSVQTYRAGDVLEGRPGDKRLVYAHKDTRWITFHASEEHNPEIMLDLLTCKTFKELEQGGLKCHL